MASNLNRPADFLKRKNVSPQMPLIPPSAFERPLVASPSELNKVKQEIEELKQENEKLRTLHVPEERKHVQHSQPDYAEELIRRQAREISEVKAELEACQCVLEHERSEWGRRVKDMEEDHSEERRRTDKLLQYKDDELDERVSRITAEYEKTVEDLRKEAAGLQEILAGVRSSMGARVLELEESLKKSRQESEASTSCLQEELRKKSHKVEEQDQQINQLKAYIGESDVSRATSHTWRLEKEALENRLKLAHTQTEQLRSELELMDVRYNSLNGILLLQEGQLSKAQPKPEVNNKGKQHKLVITKWREKVFELLVQLKSAEISHQNDENIANEHIAGLEEKLSSSQASEEMLTHALAEKDAQWKMEVNRRQQTEQELEVAQQVVLNLSSESQASSQVLEGLKQFFVRYEQQNTEMLKKMEEKSTGLKVLSQRVSFAASRMDLLKSQLVRRSAITLSSKVNESNKSMSRSRADDDMSRDSEEHLFQELERVMQERDMLATQVREDSDKWTQRLTQSRSQYTSQIEKMKRTVEDLEYDVQQKSKTCAQLTRELTDIRETMEEKDDTIAQLQAELAKHARGVSAVLSDQRLTDDAIWTDKLATMERKMNESRREHAKAVVTLRQLERSHAREMERSANLLHTTEEHLTRQLAALQAKLEASERDRNVMVATLRQEGLVSRVRRERGEPLSLPLESQRARLEDMEEEAGEERPDAGVTDSLTEGAGVEHSSTDKSGISRSDRQTSQANEPVESVLEDVRALTMAIFDDDDDDVEESQLEDSSDVPSAQVTSDRSDS